MGGFSPEVDVGLAFRVRDPLLYEESSNHAFHAGFVEIWFIGRGRLARPITPHDNSAQIRAVVTPSPILCRAPICPDEPSGL